MTKQYPHLDIWVNDLYGPLYNFWKELQHNGQAIAEQLKQYKIDNPTPDTAKNLFLESKEIVNEDSVSNLLRACAFYVINKCSFSGLTESSSFSRQASDSNFSMRGIEKLPDYSLMIKDWKITNLSYEYLLSDNKQTFTYLDPLMRLEVISTESEAICIPNSTTTILLSSVTALLVLNLYLIIRLNSFVRGLKTGKQQNSPTPTPCDPWETT